MIGFSIVGCGHIAKKHAEAIQRVPEAYIAGVFDIVPDRMQPYCELYDAEACATFDALLQNPGTQVVNICAPSGYHETLAVQAAQAGKHIILEKPMAMTVAEAKRIYEACERYNVKLSIVHPNRFRPAVQLAYDLITSGALGTISHVGATVRWNRNDAYYEAEKWRGTWKLDGGILLNQAIHMLDLLVWMMGDVTHTKAYHATRAHSIETDDVAVGILEFASGGLGVLEATVNVYEKNLEETLSIFGTKGTIKLGGTSVSNVEFLNLLQPLTAEQEGLLRQSEYLPFGPGHAALITDMCEAIHMQREPLISGRDGIKVMEVIERMNGGIGIERDSV